MSTATTDHSSRRLRARCLVLAAAAAATVLSLPARLQAATKTWTNGNGTGIWSDAGNWSPAGVPPNPVPATDDLNFNGLTSIASAADAPWTVSTLNFFGSNTSTIFTLSGSPLTITRSINSDIQVNPTIQNALVLNGTDNGRGPEVDFGFIPNPVSPQMRLSGSVTGPARIRIANAGRAFFDQVPQNAGGPLATLDPGGPDYGLLIDNPSGAFSIRATAAGSQTFFGNASTAIAITGGMFRVSPANFAGVITITNPFSVITSGNNTAAIQSTLFVGGQHRVNLTGPILLKGALVLHRPGSFNDQGIGGIGQDLQGTVTVAATNAAIFDFEGASDSLISGNITQNGTPRTLTLGHDGDLTTTASLLGPFLHTVGVLQLSGDNTGLTGGIRVIGVTNPGSYYLNSLLKTRFAYRFLSLASMGGGGNGNVFIGPNATAGIGFPLSDAALDKIDPTSTGIIGIDADSSLDIDLSPAGRNMPNVKIGSSVKAAQGPVHYTGHLTPFGNTYQFASVQFGAPQVGGNLSLDAVNALSGARALNVGPSLNLILSAPQSFTGPIQIGGTLTVDAAGAINPNTPIALEGIVATLAIGRSDNTVSAYAHNADITLTSVINSFPTFSAKKTTGGAGYDLLLNGSIRGGGPNVQANFSGGGTIVLNGPNNDFAGTVAVNLNTTLLVNSSLPASVFPLTLSAARLGGTGTILRQVMTESATKSILAPGGYPNPTGTLTIDSLQVAGATAPITYEFQFNADSNDFLKILHDFTNPAGGTSILKLLPIGGGDSLGRTIPFLDVDGAIPNAVGWTVDTSLAPQYAGSFVTFDPGSAVYSVTLVPEPTSIGLLLAMPLLWRRRRLA